jgi:hypothetical protein
MLGALFAVQFALVALRLAPLGLLGVLGVALAFGAPGFYASRRSWTTVGPAGISVYWGVGRARTYSWQQIRWIDVRETNSQFGTTRAVRVFLTDGRRRSLPGLIHSAFYPAPDLAVVFQQIVKWWELSTDREARFRPRRQLRDRVTPGVLGVILGLLLVVVLFVVGAVAGS